MGRGVIRSWLPVVGPAWTSTACQGNNLGCSRRSDSRATLRCSRPTRSWSAGTTRGGRWPRTAKSRVIPPWARSRSSFFASASVGRTRLESRRELGKVLTDKRRPALTWTSHILLGMLKILSERTSKSSPRYQSWKPKAQGVSLRYRRLPRRPQGAMGHDHLHVSWEE